MQIPVEVVEEQFFYFIISLNGQRDKINKQNKYIKCGILDQTEEADNWFTQSIHDIYFFNFLLQHYKYI